ncbi:MAG: hypothetical protein ACRET8_02655, partial [Burkholderiales bacterium]
VRVAAKLKIPTVILPLGAGVFSAFGLLASPLCFDAMRTLRMGIAELTLQKLGEGFQPLVEEASALLRDAGVAEKQINVVRRLDMRYKGQGFEVEVTLPPGGDPAALRELPGLFKQSYERVFSLSLIEEAIELVNWKVEATGPQPKVELRQGLAEALTAGDPLKGRRRAYFVEAGGYVDCAVYNRYAMQPGMTIVGPALVEERESTSVVGVGQSAEIDRYYNLVVTLSGQEARP